MSREARDWVYRVMERGVVPLSTLAVLFALADHHNPKYGCFPSQKKLCTRLGVSMSTLHHHLKILKGAGLIDIRKRRRGIEYVLNTSDISEPTLPIYEKSPAKNQGDTSDISELHLNPVIPDSENPVRDWFRIRETDLPCGVPEGESEEKKPEPEPNFLGAQEGSVTGKELPVSENEVAPVKVEEIVAKQMKPKTEAEILAKVEKAKQSPKGITPTVLGHLWRDLHGLYLPEYTMAGITHVQMKQLAQAAKAAGAEFVPALVLVLKDWESFCLHCQSLKVFPAAKPMPETQFVLKNIQIVVLFYRENLMVQSAALSKPAKKVAKVVEADALPAEQPVPEHRPATLEEAEAILKGTYHGT